MKNFPVNVEGREFWISRSVAVVPVVIINSIKENNTYVIANKRGKGVPNEAGKWNVPCGYLDWDETVEEAAEREIFEETGYIIPAIKFKVYGLNSNPKEYHQNVSIRMWAFLLVNSLNDLKKGKPTGGEKNEVEEVKLIPIADIGKYDWAFGHDKRIFECYQKFIQELA